MDTNKAKVMTRETVGKILSKRPHNNAFMRHFSRIVKPFNYEKGLYEMEDTATGWYLIGTLEEATEFLMNA